MCDESDQNTAFQKQILHLSADEPAIGRHAELRHFHLAVGGENNGFYVGTHRVLHRTYILNDFVCRYVLRCHGIGEARFSSRNPSSTRLTFGTTCSTPCCSANMEMMTFSSSLSVRDTKPSIPSRFSESSVA